MQIQENFIKKENGKKLEYPLSLLYLNARKCISNTSLLNFQTEGNLFYNFVYHWDIRD